VLRRGPIFGRQGIPFIPNLGRDIVGCLKSNPELLYHWAFRGRVTRTNLASANQHRAWCQEDVKRNPADLQRQHFHASSRPGIAPLGAGDAAEITDAEQKWFQEKVTHSLVRHFRVSRKRVVVFSYLDFLHQRQPSAIGHGRGAQRNTPVAACRRLPNWNIGRKTLMPLSRVRIAFLTAL